MAKIKVLDTNITIVKVENDDYISLTDMAKSKNPTDANEIIRNWLRNRNTIEFLGIWEKIYNPNFKTVEFDGFKKEAGLNSFTLSSKKWVEKTNAIGVEKLNQVAISQMQILTKDDNIKKLESK